MSDLSTKAFAAQDALTAALQASPDLAAWHVDYGLPNRRGELEVWVDEELTDWHQAPYTTGLESKSERFTLRVFVYARKTGATALEIRDLLKSAGGRIEAVIGSAPFLGGAVSLASVSGGEYGGGFADTDGRMREAVLRLDVDCETFLG